MFEYSMDIQNKSQSVLYECEIRSIMTARKFFVFPTIISVKKLRIKRQYFDWAIIDFLPTFFWFDFLGSSSDR